MRNLKRLVYPRRLIVIADREFGRTRLFEVLKKAGIYWVIRVPKNSYPPKLGDYRCFSDEGHDEPWLLCYRLPPGYDPVELYHLRMRIEQTFRDAKSLLSMRAIINRVNNPSLKDGLILLLFASWLFLVEVGRKAKESGVLLQSLLNMAENGYYSPITLGRLWLCACATRTLNELLVQQGLTGG
ncbi:MAG: transposase [candidate division WOR-3 bacterium]